MKKSQKKKPTVDTLCSQLAGAILDERKTLTELLADRNELTALFESVEASVRANEPNALTSRKLEQQFRRFQQALPEAMRKEFLKYDDATGVEEGIARDAGYLIGVAVGRRLGGAR